MNEEGKILIRSAFEMARSSGKDDWRHMTVAVLKNRLLALTKGAFTESAYGATTMRELVEQAPDVVRLDPTVLPHVVELVAEGPSDHRPSESRLQGAFAKVRPDLWRAVMDYSSALTYVWDDKEGAARERREDDDPARVLPTIDAAKHSQWRKDFAAAREDQFSDAVRTRVEAWVSRGLPSTVLPANLRRDWLAHLRAHVERIVREWFAERGLDAPSDLIVRRPRSEVSPERSSHLEALRQVVVDCVTVMTEEELAQLRLPPTAVLRARRSRS